MSKQLGLFGKPAVEVPKPRLGRPRKQGDEEPVAAAELAVVLSPAKVPELRCLRISDAVKAWADALS